jgi:DNA-binding transcriptional LysR family regulator
MDTLCEANLDWDDIRFFVALAETGTLAAAARAMKISHVTVSRRLANLERNLGCALLQRRPDGYQLTAEGAAVLANALEMRRRVQEICDTTTDKGDTVKGVIRLSLTRTLADHFIAPRLTPFIRANPGVIVELMTESRNVSIARREADIALRLARPVDGEMIARRVATLSFGFYAAAHVNVDEGSFIAFAEGEDIAEAAWLARFIGDRRTPVRSSSPTVQMVAAETGLGLALLPNYLAQQNPRLQKVRLTEDLPTREIWLVRPKEQVHSARLRRFVNYIVELFDHEKHLFSKSEPSAGAQVS